MARSRHPDKEIEEAISYAESQGWTLKKQGHWGRMYCAQADQDGCQFGVSGTPRKPETHAKQIKRAVNRCPHRDKDEEADDGI